jgi:hypothetical protein
MLRQQAVLAVVLAILPSYLCAQFEVTISGGFHVDRAPESDRLVTEGGAAMYADRGDASAFGGRIGFWRTPRFGFQLDLSRSSNASWSGSAPLPPPAFANRTTYLSTRAVFRTAPDRRLQFGVAAGPAVMIYGGTGTNLRTRGADVGGVVEASARLRIVHQLALQVAASNYFYGSRYRSDPMQGGSQIAATQSVFRHDLLLLPGLVYSWH